MTTRRAALLFAAALALAVWLLARSLSTLPIEDSGLAIDWKQIWAGTHNFSATYGSTELRTPPWALPPLWVLTLFPLSTGWALMALLTLAALLASVPRGQPRRWALAALLLCSSYPALRQLADGNLEALVIAGSLLLLVAARKHNLWLLASGLLLASAKIQATWIFLMVYAVCELPRWPRRQLLNGGLAASAVALPLLAWKGAAWWQAIRSFPWPGTAIDASLQAVAARAGLPGWLYFALAVAIGLAALLMLQRNQWRLGQAPAGGLLAAGLLLAPYAASNSVLSPLALAAPAIFMRRPVWATVLFLAANLPYTLMSNLSWRLQHESNYWALVMALILIVAAVTSSQASSQH